MERAVAEWLTNHDEPPPDLVAFTRKLCKSYLVYGPMVLLPPSAFPPPTSAPSLSTLYALISRHLKTTHIALTHPIPLLHDVSSPNQLRAPSNFEPLHGSFGPPTCAQPPSPQDFAAAFWVTAKQNALRQTWAPRWTMFSRGNISEKARLLTLDSVTAAVQHGHHDGRGCAAVDLYVGIGYFAFSYLKAGVRVVLGWDLNAWSLEGLRRGAEGNGWNAVVVGPGEKEGGIDTEEARVVAFHESNERALTRVTALKRSTGLPPVRHVNCGLLPTSRDSWETALNVLDSELGGWVHVHENFAVADIEAKAEEVRQAFQKMMQDLRRSGMVVQLEGINRLKSYAPGVIHCVVDIYIPPSSLKSTTATS
nr:trna wybutosine-synthesizing protein 2 [Quercus suber]